MKLTQIKENQYITSIPVQIVRMMNWTNGTKLKIEMNDRKELILKKVN